MKIRVLGCSGAEVPKENLPSYLIDGKILLDAGTIGAVLRKNQQWKIRHILLTHAHLDHIKGIPFLADNIIINEKNHHITLVSKLRILHTLRRSLLNNIVWPDFTKIPDPENPIIRFKLIGTGIPTDINGYTVTAYSVSHGMHSVGFLVEDSKGKRLLYTGDTGPTDAIWKALRGTKIHGLIIEASFPNKMKELAIKSGHLTPRLLKAELKKLGTPPERIFITHCKPRYKAEIKKEIKRLGFNNIEILKDGQVIEL
ncbi:MAG: MBL fold metallo-hydrolase [Deltaproteobacteria bacterium]|nr:MBL fold metallo-hydrolase [Deltaproteobacteria bacterium]